MSRTHGLASTYKSGGCRCDACRQANSEFQSKANAKRAALLAEDPTLAEHGTVSTYRNWGCRCEPCTAANKAACAAYYRTRR